ncbi:MAG: hypothetical protein WBB28_20695 [Crinalium sp.]
MPREVKYPNITVKLTGLDSNAFVLMGAVESGLKQAKVDQQEILAFKKEAMSSSYDALIATCMRWVNIT